MYLPETALLAVLHESVNVSRLGSTFAHVCLLGAVWHLTSVYGLVDVYIQSLIGTGGFLDN